MNNTVWKTCHTLRFINNLISNRFVYANAIHHIVVEPRQNYIRTLSQSSLGTLEVFETWLKPANRWTFYRNYSKKRKPVNTYVEEKEEEDEEESDDEDTTVPDGENVIFKKVPSLRLDTILKAGLGLGNKKVEKEFYDSNIRVNGEKVKKKSCTLHIGDEVDIVQGVAPENPKFLSVHRVCIISVGKITEAAIYPVKLSVFKDLAIENYQDAWESVKEELE